MEIPKKDIKKWIEALRSGEFKQGRGMLETPERQFCCLGVACKLLVPGYVKTLDGRLFGSMPTGVNGAPEWLHSLATDFQDRTYRSIPALNDELGYTFDEIADMLQAVYILEVLK